MAKLSSIAGKLSDTPNHPSPLSSFFHRVTSYWTLTASCEPTIVWETNQTVCHIWLTGKDLGRLEGQTWIPRVDTLLPSRYRGSLEHQGLQNKRTTFSHDDNENWIQTKLANMHSRDALCVTKIAIQQQAHKLIIRSIQNFTGCFKDIFPLSRLMPFSFYLCFQSWIEWLFIGFTRWRVSKNLQLTQLSETKSA